MRVDFYQLSRDPAEKAVAGIARNTLKAGERLLVVSADPDQLDRVSTALWEEGRDSFLANGRAGGEDDARQPILLSQSGDPANGARFVVLADGNWRDPADSCARVFYVFGETTLQEARDCWRALGTRDAIERRFWKQEAGRWVEGP